MNGRGSYDFGGTTGKRFGASKRFGILGDAVFDYNGRGIDNIQPALDPLSTFAIPFYDSNTIREYRYYRTRYGFDGSADYHLTPSTTLYAHGFYSDLKDWGDKWYYEPVSAAIGGTAADPVYPRRIQKVFFAKVLHLQQAPQRLSRHPHPRRPHRAPRFTLSLSDLCLALL